MTRPLRLHKLDASGNDFLVAFVDELPDDAEAARSAVAWCDRRVGIGADGLIFAVHERHSDGTVSGTSVRMRLRNSDGSVAEVSGNGLRCLAHAVARELGKNEFELMVETDAGLRTCRIWRVPDDRHTVVGVGAMGRVEPGPWPDVEPDAVASVLEGLSGPGAPIGWKTVCVGNPHIVVEVPDPGAVPLHEAGPAVEALFRDGINVHFGAVIDENVLRVSVWERGAGATKACGSGAVAAASVFNDWGRVGQYVTVRMPGGVLEVDLSDPVKLEGRSKYVARVPVPDSRGFEVQARAPRPPQPPAGLSDGADG